MDVAEPLAHHEEFLYVLEVEEGEVEDYDGRSGRTLALKEGDELLLTLHGEHLGTVEAAAEGLYAQPRQLLIVCKDVKHNRCKGSNYI